MSRSSLDRREEGTCYRTLARIARREGDASKARENYNRAIAVFRLIQDRIELARTLEERAPLTPMPGRDWGEARSLYTRACMTEDAARTSRAIEKDVLPDPAIRDSRTAPDPFDRILTCCSLLQAKIRYARQVASTTLSILLTGETGTGKELFALAIHEIGRAGRHFIILNCATLPENLLESELFGHRCGAFSGAVRDSAGLLEQADSGTLFIDELDKASLSLQSKLLRFLDTGEIRRVGETRMRSVRVRVIAATSRDLSGLVKREEFLPDLLFRIRGARINLPPLRKRLGDVVFLARFFLQEGRQAGEGSYRFSPDAIALLQSYPWPGNVRELKAEVERSVLFAKNGVIDSYAFDPAIRGARAVPSAEFSLKSPLIDQEKRVVQNALRSAKGNITHAAQILGIARSTLYGKIRRLGIRVS